MQVGAGAVVNEQWLEVAARHIPLQMLVVFQVLRRVVGDVGVDVLRRLLAADAKATELWIQNQGNSATTMQVRIVRWKQEDGHERYTAQQDVVASPPIVTIGTGNKQLIRLIKQASVPAGVEQAYRIIVDEIPQPDAKAEPAIGLKLQMHYLLAKKPMPKKRHSLLKVYITAIPAIKIKQ